MNIKIVMEQVAGIEPASIPWQGIVLPINYICILKVYTKMEWLLEKAYQSRLSQATTPLCYLLTNYALTQSLRPLPALNVTAV